MVRTLSTRPVFPRGAGRFRTGQHANTRVYIASCTRKQTEVLARLQRRLILREMRM